LKYISEYRDKNLIDKLSSAIQSISFKDIRLMEVCGGHTLAIRKFGIPDLLPASVKLLSGPGCPVCVTDRPAIDKCIALAQQPGVILTTYGDLIRVPGSYSSLAEQRAKGCDVRIVYSTLEALAIAADNPSKKVIFAGIGFETTTPSSAVAILEAARLNVPNFFLYSMHKLMPPAMAALIDQGIEIDGYIGPGHVTAVAGSNMYNELVQNYGISVVVSGFEPVDILQSVYMLVEMFEQGRHGTEVQYKRVVTPEGNIKARESVSAVFETANDTWRGLGLIPGSGLKIRREYSRFDAVVNFNPEISSLPEPKGCLCGEVLRGLKSPEQCKLFGKVCTPLNPIGACMVSGEGACQAHYRYRT